MPPVGATARRSRTVTQRDIELFTELSVVVLDGDAHVYREPLATP